MKTQAIDDKQLSILFVDDEEKALKYFTKAFANDFSIKTCKSVQAAKLILEQESEQIAVLITDQRMPKEKGVELLKYARQEYPHIVRLLTTAYSDLSDAIESVNKGEILRYVTKPWNVENLHTDLSNAMQFFSLRRERDQLLGEKLSIKQRMMEVNRARDLIVMASGFTHLRHPIQAVTALLLELPALKQSKTSNIDAWGLMEKEINTQLKLANELIRQTSTELAFESGSLEKILNKICDDYSENVVLKTGSLASSKFNTVLIEKMLQGLLLEFINLHTSSNKIQLITETNSNGSKITINLEQVDLSGSSLLETPVELIAAFFICYHHGGQLSINTSSGLQCEILLPSDPEKTELPLSDDNWIEEIFSRFEEWA